jgi:hypothetical protein
VTFNNIYEFFENDTKLMDYYDPTSSVTNNKDASLEIYHKLIEHAKEKECHFKRNEIGYIFYSGKLLISFCVKPEFRSKENLTHFGDLIKKELGEHFECCLFNKNTRAINFLEKIGMKKQKSNNLITLLSI